MLTYRHTFLGLTLHAWCIQSSLHGLSARRCPMSLHFLTRWVSQLLATFGSGILGFCPCWCPSPFHSPSISRCFSIHFSSPAIGFHSSIFYGGGICTPPPTLLLYPGLGTAQDHSRPWGGVYTMLYMHAKLFYMNVKWLYNLGDQSTNWNSVYRKSIKLSSGQTYHHRPFHTALHSLLAGKGTWPINVHRK